MPIDFVPKSTVKSAERIFTAPIVSAETFDGIITSLLATEDNPLGANGANGVTVSSASYGATIAFIEETEGKTVGTVTLRGKTRAAINASVTAALADTALATAFGGDAVQDTTKNAWSVKLKCNHPATGETYYLAFTRESLTLSSYEADAVLATVEAWADTVTALN